MAQQEQVRLILLLLLQVQQIGYYFFACGHQGLHKATSTGLSKLMGMATFGTTALFLVQEQTHPDIGIFEYDVPTGYTALSTKGLQE